MTWRAMDLADVGRHVIGCHLTQETTVLNSLYDLPATSSTHILLHLNPRFLSLMASYDVASDIRLCAYPHADGERDAIPDCCGAS